MDSKVGDRLERQALIFFNYTLHRARAIGLLETMSIDTFIQIHQTRIRNIDGNLDTATITVLTPEGKLAFYWFDNGQMARLQTMDPVAR